MAMKIDIKTLPKPAKVIISILPALVIILLVIVIVIAPKNKEIKALENKISAQENEIAKGLAKAEKLPELILMNKRLRKRLDELKEQLPEEKEVSGLLKQVSDEGIKSGLRILLWKPEQKRTHVSGVVFEIPVKIQISGNYHALAYFFSRLTILERIVNISDIKLSNPKSERNEAILNASFTATTFSAIPEGETVTTQKPVRGR